MKKKALIVEDEEQARLYLAKMIAVSFPDMEIQFAATPEEALFVLERNKTDILGCGNARNEWPGDASNPEG